MGLSITARIVCDKCTVNNADLSSVDSPIPNGWMKDQGYANIMTGSSVALIGYYCPTCIDTFGTKALVKVTSDIADGLTDPRA